MKPEYPATGTLSTELRQPHWFGASARLVGGEPDTRYGWMDWPGGPCIVKALNTDLTAYGTTLLQHERHMLRRLATLGAPVPEQVDLQRPDWLATRFAGLSLQRLTHPAGLQGVLPTECLPFAERLSVWVHLLRSMQSLAQQGVLVADLYDGNVVVPLTGTTHGQLRLHQPMLIDHAHTLEAGMNMQRPVWVNRHMQRIAPELRQALQADQQALENHFLDADADLPGHTQLQSGRSHGQATQQRRQHNRQVWASYRAPQQLQRLLDSGNLSCDHAMQFAAGKASASLLSVADTDQSQILEVVLTRMMEAEPANRYPSLQDAAHALASVVPRLPLVSQHSFGPLQPTDLAIPAWPGTDLNGATPDMVTILDALKTSQMWNGAETTEAQNLRMQDSSASRWLYAAFVIGTALGSAVAWLKP
jgi:hypothetical protein